MRHAAAALFVLLLAAPGHAQTAKAPASKPAAPGKPATTSAPATAADQPARTTPGAGAVIVLETVKGRIEIETYPNEAPKTVEHVIALVKRNFYNGLRIHRVDKGFVVQFGDPQTRDMTKRDMWGRGFFAGSGHPIGVAEFSKKRTHVAGAVAMAHPGKATDADSQMYITLAPMHALDGKFTVFGRVISGMDIVQKLAVEDMIRRGSVRDAGK